MLRGDLGPLGCARADPPGKIESRARAAVENPSREAEAFRALYAPDLEPIDPELEDESKHVGALLRAVEFEWTREALKSLKAIEAILTAVHTKR